MKWRTIFLAQWPGDSTVWRGDCSLWAASLERAGCNVTRVRMVAMRSTCPACAQGLTH